MEKGRKQNNSELAGCGLFAIGAGFLVSGGCAATIDAFVTHSPEMAGMALVAWALGIFSILSAEKLLNPNKHSGKKD